MATKGVELASAYISLSVETSSVAREIRDALNGSTRDVKRVGSQAGRDYAGSFSSAMRAGMGGGGVSRWLADFKTEAHRSGNAAGYAAGRAMGAAMTAGLAATTAGLTAAIGGIGFTLFKGFDRYKSLDATAKRLQGMGKTGDEVRSIMADINSVVEGTPIALDAAADSATQFLSGGVRQGEQLRDVLTSIADAAGASGGNFEDFALIFGQVMNKGKLQAEEMMQLNERGINIQAALREEFGLTADELDKMSKDGTVSFGMLVQAIEGKFGGMSKRMGDTIDGAIGNMQTAVGRVGANFISAIFGDPLSTTEGPGGMAQAINNVTGKIDDLNTWVVGHQGEIKQFFTDAADTAKGLGNAVKDVATFLKEHPGLIHATVGAFAAWKTIQGVSALATALRGINTMLGTTIPASAERGAGRVSSALLGVAGVAMALPFYNQGLDKLNEKTGLSLDSIPGSGIWLWNGLMNGDWELPWQQGRSNPATPSTTGTAIGQGRGAGTTGGDALDPGFFLGDNNPNDLNTGGALTPSTAALQDYLRNQIGFTGTIGGWREPDGYNEHSSGKALDVMIGGPQEGYALLPNMLTRPGVEYVIWDSKMWYPDGSTSAYTGPNPHTDHLHVKTFGTGGDVRGPGTGTSDSIPAWLSNGEHVLTAADVAAMGGQAGVYAFRNAIHRKNGGEIVKSGAAIWPPQPPGPKDKTRPGGIPDLGKGKNPGPHLPDWGPGTTFGPPPGDWWFKPVNPDDILFPEWLGPGYPWKHPKDKDRIRPFNDGGPVDELLPGEKKQIGWMERGNFQPGVKLDTSKVTWSGEPGWYGLMRRTLPEDAPGPLEGSALSYLAGFGPHAVSQAQWISMITGTNRGWLKHLGVKRKPPIPGFTEGGAVNPDELLQMIGFQGPDPNTTRHGMGQGQPPGPRLGPNGQPVGPDGQPIGAQIAAGMMRTEGFIPAAAGFSGKTGGGLAGSLINLGAEAINSLIDQAAQAASTAVAAGVAGGTMGAGAPAAPAAGAAAQAAIGIGTEAAKRGVQYGAEMLNIGIGAATEFFSPFGAPRWLADVDPTGFIPRMGVSPAATTTGEALTGGISDALNPQQHGMQAGQPPGPVPHQPGPPPGPIPPSPGVGGAVGQPVQAAAPKPPEPASQGEPFNFVDIIKGGVFDSGGVLAPNSAAVNLSSRPEYVFTDSQWKTMEAHASRGGGTNVTYNVMGKDLDDALREMKKHERRASGPLMRGKAGL